MDNNHDNNDDGGGGTEQAEQIARQQQEQEQEQEQERQRKLKNVITILEKRDEFPVLNSNEIDELVD
jgi:hypothetical protein